MTGSCGPSASSVIDDDINTEATTPNISQYVIRDDPTEEGLAEDYNCMNNLDEVNLPGPSNSQDLTLIRPAGTQGSTGKDVIKAPHIVRPTRKDLKRGILEKMVQLEERKVLLYENKQASIKQTQNADYNFLLSLLSSLRAIPLNRKLLVQRQTEDVFINKEICLETQTPTYLP